jgi:hypothetical protein
MPAQTQASFPRAVLLDGREKLAVTQCTYHCSEIPEKSQESAGSWWLGREIPSCTCPVETTGLIGPCLFQTLACKGQFLLALPLAGGGALSLSVSHRGGEQLWRQRHREHPSTSCFVPRGGLPSHQHRE